MDLKGQKRIADLVIRDFEMDSDLNILYEIAAASDYEFFCLWLKMRKRHFQSFYENGQVTFHHTQRKND